MIIERQSEQIEKLVKKVAKTKRVITSPKKAKNGFLDENDLDALLEKPAKKSTVKSSKIRKTEPGKREETKRTGILRKNKKTE